ncbi:SurA N-terminal domain-containing protein [Streptomyces sp. N2-109]|uniref:SurA N-terminal domain-containing protein n=1 Tax=Streptomyces gossypii TaxID=2883101 RepID=A0ABT2JYK9_9ACTN|nr:SurA N-terminal domain-containing protein [Streptomyces gossypii]MCT2592970.1 SurA N-terminal domain-containing protein [Streptomyces gossypii]MCT2593703.1 SurA N-terminal domain-containing protein [Streptomyces gossypii]
MHRRRSALTVSAAAALVVVAPLLTACGNDARPGAAAVVGDDRITLGQLQSKVGEVRDAQSAQPQGDELIKRSGQLTRVTLNSMIRHRIVKQVADDSGVTVTRRDIQQVRSQFEQRAGGPKEFRTMLLQQQAVAPSEIDDWVWLEVAVQKIAAESGINLQAPEANAQLTGKLSEAAKQMGIDVNPRYGKWSAKETTLVNAETPWLKDVTGERKDRAQQEQQPA